MLAALATVAEPGAFPVATALVTAVMDVAEEGPRDDATILALSV